MSPVRRRRGRIHRMNTEINIEINSETSTGANPETTPEANPGTGAEPPKPILYEEKKDPMRDLFPDLPRIEGERVLLRPLELRDAADLSRMTRQDVVYRYLPTYLFEKQSDDAEAVIRGMYGEGLESSLILGVFRDGRFCGLAEFYGYRAPIRKASVGYRLLKECWGQGIASEVLTLLLDELLCRRGIEIITASSMIENRASAHLLQKHGFTLVNHAVYEDWGFPELTLVDKWIR